MEWVKIVIGMDAGCAGTDSWEFYEVPSTSTDKERSKFAWGLALDHAASYGVYPESDRPDDYDEELQDVWSGDSYSDDIDGWWETYDPDQHDGHRINGDRSWTRVQL